MHAREVPADFAGTSRVDPSATLGQYGEAEKLEDESDESAALYHVSFDAEGECELLAADKTRVLSTQSVKKQNTNE